VASLSTSFRRNARWSAVNLSNAVTAAVHDGKREARQQRATLIAAASKAAKKGFREKDQEMTKVAVYNRKSILEPP
jgi:hypothetical protein